MLKEVLGSIDDLEPVVRSVVEQEAAAIEGCNTDVASVEEESQRLDQQISFALSNLSELGEDAVKKIIQPLKEKRQALATQRSQLEGAMSRQKPDVEKTVKSIVKELKGFGRSMDEMSPQVLRDLFLSFTDMGVDLKEWQIDVDIRLPEWAVHHAGKIKEVVGVVDNKLLCR